MSLQSDAEYRAALREVSSLFDRIPEPDPATTEGQRFDALINDIEAYERQHYGEVSPIITPEGEVVELSEAVVAGMLPSELLFAPRDGLRWREWRAEHIEWLPRAARVLVTAVRQRLHQRQPAIWQDVLTIVNDALRVAEAREDASGSKEIASVLETMRALHDNDALSDSELADFERTAGVRKPTQDVLEADAAYAETAFETFAKQPTSPATLDSPVWVHIERKRLLLGLADGRWVSCPIDWFPRLERGDSASLGSPQLSPLGIHWPGVDEDISVDGLFAGRGDLTIGSGQRARFIDAPTPRIERVGHGIDTAHLQLSDGRCLGIPLDAITHTRRAPDSDHPLRPSPTEKT